MDSNVDRIYTLVPGEYGDLCKLLILLVRTKYGADFALNKRVTQEHFYRKNYV